MLKQRFFVIIIAAFKFTRFNYFINTGRVYDYKEEVFGEL
jgi:hypothetical protein